MKGHSLERALKSSKSLFAWTYRGTGSESPPVKDKCSWSQGLIPSVTCHTVPFPSCLLLTAVEQNGEERWFEQHRINLK